MSSPGADSVGTQGNRIDRSEDERSPGPMKQFTWK